MTVVAGQADDLSIGWDRLQDMMSSHGIRSLELEWEADNQSTDAVKADRAKLTLKSGMVINLMPLGVVAAVACLRRLGVRGVRRPEVACTSLNVQVDK